MLATQSIDPSDALMVFEGLDVITESGKDGGPYSRYQKTLGDLGYTSIMVDVALVDMTDGSTSIKNRVEMTYRAAAGFWSIDTSSLATSTSGTPMLVVGHKYTGVIKQSNSDTNSPNPDMRDFTLCEFTVDDRSLDKTLMTQGFELDTASTPSRFIWRDSSGNMTYKADAYTGGVGTTPATSAADVTHRGPITKYV